MSEQILSVTCGTCGYEMSQQPARCEACDQPLEYPFKNGTPRPGDETLVMQTAELLVMPKPQKVWQSAEVDESRVVEMIIGSLARSVTLLPEDIVTLGRGDESKTGAVDVNLSTHDAFSRGVSRVHAALRLDRDMLMIQDLGSSNGTFVNGQRVSGDQWRVVRNQDELRLGSLSIKVRFNSRE